MPPDSEGETSDATSAVDTVIDAGEKVDQNISEVDSLSITKSVGGGGQTTEINSAIHETSPQDESDNFTKEALEEEKTNQEIPNQTTTMKDEEIIETTISVPVLNNTKQQQSSNPTEVIQIQVQPKIPMASLIKKLTILNNQLSQTKSPQMSQRIDRRLLQKMTKI